MNIEDMTIGQAKELASMFGKTVSAIAELPVGKNVFIRTVTHYYTGRLVSQGDKFLVLESAAWIADTGRFSDALRTGELNEVEPFPPGPVYISMGAIVDISIWSGVLPLVKK